MLVCHEMSSQINYDDFFQMQSLRIDYMHCGNNNSEVAYLEQLKQEPFWAGNHDALIDKFNYGEYRIMVYDSASNKLIYSNGYGTLFREWQTTDEAKTISRSFYEAVNCPYPKNTVKILLESRDKHNQFHTLLEVYVNPKNYFIKKEISSHYKIFKVLSSGIPSKAIDIVIIPDGYTEVEMIKFRKDALRFTDYLFNCSPYKENKDKFNIRAIEAISHESGPDIPADSIWNSTVVSSSFYTFDSERYLMTYDYKAVKDIAAQVPYDQIIILVNSSKYGGGGIYNFYNTCSSDNEASEFVLTHEFGHGFAALADEYYSSDVAYNDYFDLSVEPYQANITTLVDFESKWKDMIEEGIPVPTPDESIYYDKVGVFEGGGYVAKGMYRPMHDCSMKSIIVNGFCPVCQRAIEEMIKENTK